MLEWTRKSVWKEARFELGLEVLLSCSVPVWHMAQVTDTEMPSHVGKIGWPLSHFLRNIQQLQKQTNRCSPTRAAHLMRKTKENKICRLCCKPLGNLCQCCCIFTTFYSVRIIFPHFKVLPSYVNIFCFHCDNAHSLTCSWKTHFNAHFCDLKL